MKQKNNFFVYNHTESYKPDFRNLKKGDIVFVKGAAHRLQEDAHLCGDSTYDGYLTYDMDGESLFSEDIDSQE